MVHVTSRGTSFIKNGGKLEDQDLYVVGSNESLKLFPGNLILGVARRQKWPKYSAIWAVEVIFKTWHDFNLPKTFGLTFFSSVKHVHKLISEEKS